MKNFIIIISLLCLAFNSNSQNIYTYAGIGTSGNTGDGGAATLAQCGGTMGIDVDIAGNVYFCDFSYGRIRKIDTNGNISTIAGGGTSLSDGIPATSALLPHPMGIKVDMVGNVYFSETTYNQVRKISQLGIITTVAGAPITPGSFGGDGGPAILAYLHNPFDVTLDTIGNVYIADRNNARIRKVDTLGIISTIAGSSSAGFSGDLGLATLAKLYNPEGITVDKNGNIYLSDSYNFRIRKIDKDGIISTIAGNGIQGFSGDGGQSINAKIGLVRGIKLDDYSNLYITDLYYGTIRKINNSGIINTIVGTGFPGYSGDGAAAILAQIKSPFATIDKFGNIFISDGLNYRIRKVCNGICALNVNELNTLYQISIYPNPTTGNLFISDENNAFQNSTIQIKNYLGQVVFTTPFASQINLQNLSAGMYFLTIQDKSSSKTVKFIKQ